MRLQRCPVCGYEIAADRQMYCVHDGKGPWFGYYISRGGDVPDKAVPMVTEGETA